jgi:hypothetical protein
MVFGFRRLGALPPGHLLLAARDRQRFDTSPAGYSDAGRIMSILLTVVLSLFAAAAIAYLEFRYKMRPARLDVYDTIRNGVWTTNRKGEESAEALRIHRARIARYTGFGMNRKEAIYWGTSVDSNGELLNCSSTYRIDGVDPDTRWWCMTVYQDQFFIPNPFD